MHSLSLHIMLKWSFGQWKLHFYLFDRFLCILLCLCSLHVWLQYLHRQHNMFKLFKWVSISRPLSFLVSNWMGQCGQFINLSTMCERLPEMHSSALSMYSVFKQPLPSYTFMLIALSIWNILRQHYQKLYNLQGSMRHLQQWVFMFVLYLWLHFIHSTQWKSVYPRSKMP